MERKDYLHANDGIDEEQNGNEQAHIWESLQATREQTKKITIVGVVSLNNFMTFIKKCIE